eukprot:jgi/Mesvir1/10639/Mv09277-RA.1
MYNPIDCDTLVCYLHEWIASTLIDGRYLDWLPLPRLTADASSDAGQAASRSDAHMLREVIRPKSRLAEELLADVSDVLGREGTLPGRPGEEALPSRPGRERPGQVGAGGGVVAGDGGVIGGREGGLNKAEREGQNASEYPGGSRRPLGKRALNQGAAWRGQEQGEESAGMDAARAGVRGSNGGTALVDPNPASVSATAGSGGGGTALTSARVVGAGMDQLIQRRPGKESLSRSGTVSSPEQSLQNAEQVFQWAFGTVYGDMKAAGLDVTPFVASSLISVCAAAGLGHLGAAMQVFEDLQRGRGGQPNTEVYSALINLCAKEGQIETAFTLYRQMAERGLAPNAYTFASLLDACAVAGDVDRANAVFTAMKDLMSGDRHEREKRERERGRGGVAVGAGGGGGVLGVGRREGKPFGVSQKGPQPLPDNVAFNNVLKLFRKHEMVDDALALYQEMKAPGGAAGCLAPTASLSTC